MTTTTKTKITTLMLTKEVIADLKVDPTVLDRLESTMHRRLEATSRAPWEHRDERAEIKDAIATIARVREGIGEVTGHFRDAIEHLAAKIEGREPNF